MINQLNIENPNSEIVLFANILLFKIIRSKKTRILFAESLARIAVKIKR